MRSFESARDSAVSVISVSALQVVLTAKEEAAIKIVPTQSVRAYEYYLRGRQLFHQRRPETLDAAEDMFRTTDGMWLIPTAEQTAAVLRRWRVGAGDRIVFYDDIGLNRQAIRGYWLLRLYRFPKNRLHILDGGIEAWRRAGQPTTTEATAVTHSGITIASGASPCGTAAWGTGSA